MDALHTLIATVVDWIVGVISATGYWGVALLMGIESACVPLPSEIIMPFAGYLVSTGELNIWWVAFAGAIGCNLGSILAYEAGRHGGRPFVARWGRYMLVSLEDLDKAEMFFRRFGSIAVLVCRLLPIVRTFIAFPAGVARMNLWKFHLYTFVGSFPFCLLLAIVGRELGEAWHSDPRLEALFKRLEVVIVVLGVAAVAWFVRHKIVQGRRDRARLAAAEAAHRDV